MDQPSPEIKYEKTPGFATTKGQMYEAKISALLFLRGINSRIDFQLASNVKGAGALDDVVFRFKDESDEWTSCFIQLKHKKNSRIKREMLTSPNGPFSLQKYCESYEDIKTAMSATDRQVLFDGNIKDVFLVIFTNARPNSDLGEGRRASEQIDEILGSNSGKVFSYDPDGVTEAEKAISDSLQNCVDCGRDFLKRLRIFADQPSEAEFDNLIKKELKKTSANFIDIDIDRLYVCFLENVKTWCEEKRNVLDRGSDLFVSARDRVLAETSSLFEVKANKLDLVFEEDALLPLREVFSGEFPMVHIGSSEQSSRLTCTKLLQTFESSTYLFLGSERFLANQSAVISEWGRGRHKTLIVSVNNRDLVTDQCHFQKIVELSKMVVSSKKILVILTDSKIETKDGFKYLEDSFEFSGVSLETRTEFLNTKFILQGCSISLEMFLASCCKDDVLSGSFVVNIIESGPKMSAGSVLTGPDEHYLPRSLHPPQANVLKSLFQVETLLETVAIVNSTMSDIVKLFFENDASLFEHRLRQSFNSSDSLFPVQSAETIFIGAGLVVGKFECSFLGISIDKPCALRCRPLKNGRPLTACCFLFVFQGTSESEVEQLAKIHQTRHFLTMKNKKLKLSKSLYDSDFIREHTELLRPNDSVDVRDRVVIVCGEPGMGKTTLMKHLAQKTKEVHPHLWVILISLNDHSKLFSEGKPENAVEFLLAAAEIKSHLERSMLKVALEVTGNVIVMLDGYDEIAPRYTEHCCQLLSSLLNTKAKKVWVTTRISVKSELESHLEMSATILCKFNDDDQRNYLKRYWSDARDSALSSGKTVLPDDELDEFINKLLEITSRSISDWGNDFLGIPLQANIMAEVFADHVTSSLKISALPVKLDLLQLLDRFIEKKLAVYIQEKLRIKPSDTNYEMHVNNIMPAYLSNHMAAAIRLILPEKYGKEWQSKKLIGDLSDFFKNIKIGEEKTGFVDSIINGKAHFVHRVFAEWFVAKWFALNLAEYGKFVEEESYHAYAGGYILSRFLCDLILAKDCELHTAVLYGDVNKVKEMLAAGADVNARDLAGRTPLHLTAAFGFMGVVQARNVEILDLLIQSPGIDFEITDELVNGTPLRYADISEHWLMMDKLLEQNVNTEYQNITTSQRKNSVNFIEFILSSDSAKLLECCLDKKTYFQNEQIVSSVKLPFNGDGLLANACQHGNLRIAKLLIERGYNINGLSKSLPDNRYPPLHCASLGGHLEIVKLLINSSNREQEGQLLQVAKESHREGLDFVNRKATCGHTALHFASAVDAKVVAFLIDHGADTESRSENCYTCLHYAARTNQIDALNVILNAVSRQNKLAFVNFGNDVQSTPLHLAAKAGFIEAVQILVSAGGKMSTDDYKQTPLMLAARNGHVEVVEFLLEALDEDEKGIGFCNTLSRTGWLNKKNRDGWTALTLAASFGFQNVVKLLIERGADTRRHNGSKTGLPKDYEHEEELLYHWRRFYLDYIMNRGYARTVAIVSTDFDGQGNIMLHIAAHRGYLEVVGILFKLGANLKSTNNAGQTPLMMAAGGGYFDVVEFLLNAFDKSKPFAENKIVQNGDLVARNLSKVEFINMKDCNGATAVCHAAFLGHKSTVDLLVEHGADVDILPHSGGQPALVFSEENFTVCWSSSSMQVLKVSVSQNTFPIPR